MSNFSAAKTPDPDLNQHLTQELLFNLYLFGRKIKHQVKQNDATHSHDQMLEHVILSLIAKKSRSVSELAELLSTGLSAMSERIKKLKDQSLIDQVEGSDGREMRCQLTLNGQVLVDQAKEKMLKFCAQATKSLNTDEVSQLNQLVKKLVFTPQPEETGLQ